MYGTGWLGWSPDQTLDTPMPQLFLALKGKVDFLKKTNPFGAGDPPKKEMSQAAKDKQSRLSLVQLEMRKKNG